jgi:hypothetical protein
MSLEDQLKNDSFNKILIDKNLAVSYDGGTKINPWTTK